MPFLKDYLHNLIRSFSRPKASVQNGKFGCRGSHTKPSQPTTSSFILESLEPRVLLSADLTAGYAFDEASGTTAADTSGNAIVGTLTNGPTWGAGKNGNGVILDGVNDYVNLGNPASLQVTGSLTLSAWVNASTFPIDDAAVVSKRASGELGFQLDVTKDTGPRTIGFKLTNSSGDQMFLYGATALQPNMWYHIAGVYDAATQSLHVYLNGQLDDGVAQGTVTTSQQNSSTTNVTIGRRAGTTGFEFAGRLDDVRIYDRALTMAEIQTDMLTPLGATGPDTIAPTVLSINRATTSPTNAATVQWTVTFSETVTGVDLADFALAATGVTGAALTGVTGSGTTYTVTANTGTGDGTLGLNLADNDSIVDASANPLGGTGAGTGNFTGQVYTIDKTAPTGTIVINGGAAATNSRNVTLTLSATDVLSNVTQMRFSNTGTSFSATEAFAPTKAWALSTGAGIKAVYVQYMDGVGNWSTAAITDTIVLDTTAPTISGRTATNITNSSAIITWTTSEPATSQVDYGLTTSYGSTTTLDPTLALSHSVTLSGLAPDSTYNYRVRSRDAAGNERVSANSTFRTAVGADTVAPTVVSINRATTSPTNAATVQWTVTFSEAVTGVDLADFALAATGVTGATLSTVTGSGTTYSVTANTGTGNGTLGLNLVDNDSIVDGSANPLGGTGVGNGNVTGQVYTIDKTAPTVTINQATGQTDPASTSPINFTVVFSKTVTGFTTGDVTLSGTAGATTATVTGSGTTYNVAVSGMTTSGTVIATVAAGVASDAAGNLNQAATSTDNTV
ncbi:MAG: LEPR-XLL domain-containing protein, partial [Nitrospira sp. LK70]|nr:LEPR-XLL domain-containing protein [Nitrospira sp. LK70]